MFYFQNLLYLFFAHLVSQASGECKVPPKFWCNTKKIAKECMVLPQCSEWNWQDEEASAVTLQVYMETLCPDTIRFISKTLFPAWEKLYSTGIMKTEIIPFGKATINHNSDGSVNFECQHGPGECHGNAIENCMMKHFEYNEEYFMPVIDCIARSKNPVQGFEKCVSSNGADWSAVSKCAENVEGHSLVYSSGAKTTQLKPELTFVPWVVINGIHTDEIQHEALTNLGWLICATYRGKQPIECKQFTQDY